jgi:hypothetical protein
MKRKKKVVEMQVRKKRQSVSAKNTPGAYFVMAAFTVLLRDLHPHFNCCPAC